MTRDAEHTPSPQSVVVPDPLWMMHVIGPDDIYPAPDHATAVQWCAYLNREIAPRVPEVQIVGVPAIWTGTAEDHAEGLAEAIKGWAVPTAPAPSSLAGGEVLSAGERAFTAWAATSRADGTSLMWTWGEMPASQQERWAKIALAALSPEAPARDEAAIWAKVEETARRYARCYPEASDGRNTFVMFAEWAASEALTPRHEAPAVTGEGQ